MTKWLVTSDSHRRVHELHTAALLVPDAKLILHAGDESTDARWLQSQVDVPVIGVSGNWDTPTSDFPFSRVCQGRVPVFLTHGHRLQVKQDLSVLATAAKEAGASIAIFGHTHLPVVQEVDGVITLNPGSVSEPRGNHQATFAVIEFIENPPEISICVSHVTMTGDVVSSVIVAPKK